MKINLLYPMLFLLIALLFGNGTNAESPQVLFEKRLGLVLRGIGHDLLLRSGDSTSKVLPVRKIAAQTYQIQFEGSLAFVPDDLIALSQERMKASGLTDTFMVNVLNCNESDVVFGFEIIPNSKESIACQGRKYPVGCYVVQVTVLDTAASPAPATPLVWGMVGLLLLGGSWAMARKYWRKPQPPEPSELNEQGALPVGNFLFWPEKRLLLLDQERIELADRESRLLKLLTEQASQLLEREYLLKVLWEDEGVFVGGRSLDVLVSKLRKKIQGDARLRITNVHGKGYKLELEA